MRYTEPLVFGHLVQRYKRFLADVVLSDGREVTAHCANPGSMKTCVEPGAPVWLSESRDPRRKLPWTLEFTVVDGCWIFVNPVRANRIVEEAILCGRVAELVGYAQLQREAPFPFTEIAPASGNAVPSRRLLGKKVPRSRVDFLLRDPARDPCYVEVKNVTLALGQGRSAFPDAVTSRGARHLEALGAVRAQGARAVLLYCASRSDAVSVEAASDIDPAYAAGLRRARDSGVEVIAYKCGVSPDPRGNGEPPTGVALHERIAVL